MSLDNEALKRLPPDERIRKLRELEEESKKDLVDADKLIKESFEELRRDRVVEDTDVPESGPVDITHLFSEEEAQQVIEKAAPEVENQVKYLVEKDYETLKELSSEPMDAYNMHKVEEISERLDTVDPHLLTKNVAHQLVASKGILYNIKKYSGLE